METLVVGLLRLREFPGIGTQIGQPAKGPGALGLHVGIGAGVLNELVVEAGRRLQKLGPQFFQTFGLEFGILADSRVILIDGLSRHAEAGFRQVALLGGLLFVLPGELIRLAVRRRRPRAPSARLPSAL